MKKVGCTAPVIDAKFTSPDLLHKFLELKVYKKLDCHQEHFVLVMLNTAMNIIGHKVLFSGGVSMSVIDPKILFYHLLTTPCTTGFVMSHNHPSGNLEPSAEDIRMTKTIREAARLFDIKLLDHIIIAGSGFTSFAQQGLL